MDFLQLTDDECVEIARRAERHLDACFEELNHEESDGLFIEVSPARALFCGCTQCEVREVLFAAHEALEDVLTARSRVALGGWGA